MLWGSSLIEMQVAQKSDVGWAGSLAAELGTGWGRTLAPGMKEETDIGEGQMSSFNIKSQLSCAFFLSLTSPYSFFLLHDLADAHHTG